MVLEQNISERVNVVDENYRLKQCCNELRAKLDRCQLELSQGNERMITMQQQLTCQLSDNKNSKSTVCNLYMLFYVIYI